MDVHHPSSFRLKILEELQDNPKKPILMEGWPRFVWLPFPIHTSIPNADFHSKHWRSIQNIIFELFSSIFNPSSGATFSRWPLYNYLPKLPHSRSMILVEGWTTLVRISNWLEMYREFRLGLAAPASGGPLETVNPPAETPGAPRWAAPAKTGVLYGLYMYPSQLSQCHGTRHLQIKFTGFTGIKRIPIQN
jgi:hypothetical protein